MEFNPKRNLGKWNETHAAESSHQGQTISVYSSQESLVEGCWWLWRGQLVPWHFWSTPRAGKVAFSLLERCPQTKIQILAFESQLKHTDRFGDWHHLPQGHRQWRHNNYKTITDGDNYKKGK
jgi:hypothetical protein